MAPPTAYTESSLATAMHRWIGTAHDALGWTAAGGDYTDAITRAMRALDVTDLADVTTTADLAALEALARYHVWACVADAAAGLTDHSLDQQSFSLSQLTKQAAASLTRAQADLRQLGLDPTGATAAEASVGRIHSLDYPRDPFAVRWPPVGLPGA